MYVHSGLIRRCAKLEICILNIIDFIASFHERFDHFLRDSHVQIVEMVITA